MTQLKLETKSKLEQVNNELSRSGISICEIMLKGRSGEIYNISRPNSMPNINLVNKIFRIVEQKIKKVMEI
jgi:dTDP-D-glucose 4,6-dehydratase